MSVPRVETQRSDQVSDVSAQQGSADLLVNNLVYTQPKALSLAVKRTYDRQYFQRNTYSGSTSETAICDWNTGTSYVKAPNSYLTFTVLPTATGGVGTCNFGSGSAMNVIREVRLKSRSGTELDRLERANLWSKFDSLWQMPQSHLANIGTSQGFSVDGITATTMTSAEKTRFIIPLTNLSPFFRPMKGQLIPPQLASGLQIQIVFEDFRTALTQTAASVGTITGYTVGDIQFQTDNVDLTDDTQKTLNMESADNGLEYSYERIYTNISQQPSASLTASVQVRKAVSQACFATSLVIDSATSIDPLADSLVTVPWDVTSFNYRLGSLYFPNQRLEDPLLDGKEAYIIAQQTYDKLQNPYNESSVSIVDFTGSQSVMASSFEKDTHLNMSGLPINNSRVLELNCEFAAFTGARDIITFLQYCVVSRSFIDNVAVAI
jgi:hypothetical protein